MKMTAVAVDMRPLKSGGKPASDSSFGLLDCFRFEAFCSA